MYKIKRFLKKIYKVLVFLPIIWDDEDWDFYYLLTLMETKLKCMQKYFEHSGIIVKEESDKVIKGIQETIEHIRDYKNCEDCEYKIKPPFEILHKSISSPDHEGFTQFVAIKKDTGKELTTEEDKQYTEYLKGTLKEEEECWNAIWDTIKAEGRSWWD